MLNQEEIEKKKVGKELFFQGGHAMNNYLIGHHGKLSFASKKECDEALLMKEVED